MPSLRDWLLRPTYTGLTPGLTYAAPRSWSRANSTWVGWPKSACLALGLAFGYYLGKIGDR
jgi:hypothetical protein